MPLDEFFKDLMHEVAKATAPAVPTVERSTPDVLTRPYADLPVEHLPELKERAIKRIARYQHLLTMKPAPPAVIIHNERVLVWDAVVDLLTVRRPEERNDG